MKPKLDLGVTEQEVNIMDGILAITRELNSDTGLDDRIDSQDAKLYEPRTTFTVIDEGAGYYQVLTPVTNYRKMYEWCRENIGYTDGYLVNFEHGTLYFKSHQHVVAFLLVFQ